MKRLLLALALCQAFSTFGAEPNESKNLMQLPVDLLEIVCHLGAFSSEQLIDPTYHNAVMSANKEIQIFYFNTYKRYMQKHLFQAYKEALDLLKVLVLEKTDHIELWDTLFIKAYQTLENTDFFHEADNFTEVTLGTKHLLNFRVTRFWQALQSSNDKNHCLSNISLLSSYTINDLLRSHSKTSQKVLSFVRKICNYRLPDFIETIDMKMFWRAIVAQKDSANVGRILASNCCNIKSSNYMDMLKALEALIWKELEIDSIFKETDSSAIPYKEVAEKLKSEYAKNQNLFDFIKATLRLCLQYELKPFSNIIFMPVITLDILSLLDPEIKRLITEIKNKEAHLN